MLFTNMSVINALEAGQCASSRSNSGLVGATDVRQFTSCLDAAFQRSCFDTTSRVVTLSCMNDHFSVLLKSLDIWEM